MTKRQRGWLLPPLAVSLAGGILLGRMASSPWYGAAGMAFSFFACLLLRRGGRFLAVLAFFLALGCLRGFFAYHPALPVSRAYQISGIVTEEIQSRANRQFRTVLSRVTLDGQPLSGTGRAYWSFYADELPSGLFPGQQVTFQGQLYHPSGASNPDGYDFREELLRRGIRVGLYGNNELMVAPPSSFSFSATLARLRHGLHTGLLRALGEEAGVYASTMLLGSRSLLPREDRTAFSRLGIAHILSVSGFHVGILIGFLGVLFRLLRLPQRIRFWLYAAALAFYSAICGWNQPVLRASLLLLLTLHGRILNRPRSLLHLLCAAWILQLLLSPVQLTGLSFQLSFGAVFGIALVTPFLASRWSPRSRLLHFLWRTLSAGLGAQAGVLLPTLYAFQELPLAGVALNIPLMAFAAALIGCFWLVLLTLPVSILCVPLSEAARLMTGGLLSVVRFLGRFSFLSLWTPASNLLTCVGMVLLVLGLTHLFRWRRRSRFLLAGGGAFLILLSLIPWPHFSTEYIQFSVGSADAALIWDQDAVYAVDTGYEDGALSDFLHRRRLTPTAVILTHLHSDHALGLVAMLEDRIPIPVLYLPADAEKADIHSSVLELLDRLRAGGTEIRYLSKGDLLSLPSGGIRVLWPEAGKTRPGQDANESSLTMAVTMKDVSLLQTGDLDGRYEMYAAMPADLLKIAHHGSSHSTSQAFLEAVHPRAALLTCDSLDRTLQVQERLESVPVFSTADRGMLTVHFSDHAFSIESFLPASGGDAP